MLLKNALSAIIKNHFIVGEFMTRKLFLIIVCILLPVIAEGADWVKVSVSKNHKEKYSVDVSSIKQVSSNQYKAWVKKDIWNNTNLKEMSAYTLFDCEERKYKALQTTFYNNDGTIKQEQEDNWSYAIPDSPWEGVLNFVCKYKKWVTNK